MGLVLGEMTSVSPPVISLGLESTGYSKLSVWTFWILAEHWEAQGRISLPLHFLLSCIRFCEW